MRYILTKLAINLLLCCLLSLGVHANDTLTVRQAYNFNVGDTFDYKSIAINADQSYSNTAYYRKILLQKSYNAQSTVLYLEYSVQPAGTFEFDTILNLDSIAIFQDSAQYNSCYTQYGFADTVFPGFISNSLDINCFESGGKFRYTKGLGRTYYATSSIANNSNGCICYSEELIYYSNGNAIIGTPYYVANGSGLVHYMPLPESCAVWTQTYYGSLTPPGNPPYGRITEQLRTGPGIHLNGINYVSLLVTIINGFNNHFTQDSLIGYFYNDTVHRSVYFVTNVDFPNPRLLYNFGYLPGQSCGGGTTQIDSLLIGGIYRTQWYCYPNSQGSFTGCSAPVIAGIGATSGLIQVLPGGPLWLDGSMVCGSLSCFSVCNETLYPHDTAASCHSFLAVEDISLPSAIKIYPNPTHETCTLQLESNTHTLTISVLNITGREVLPLTANRQLTSFTFNIGSLLPGLYFIRVINEEGEQNVLKVVKE